MRVHLIVVWAVVVSSPRLASAQVGRSSVEDATAECREFLGEGLAGQALAKCNEVLRESPGYVPALILRARALISLGKYEQASAETGGLGRGADGQQLAELASWRGFALFKLERFADARLSLKTAVAGMPSNALAHLHLCKLFPKQPGTRYAEESVTACDDYLRNRPDDRAWQRADAEVLMWKSYALHALNKPRAMMTACEEMKTRAATPINRNLADVCIVRASAEIGDCDRAVSSATALLDTKNPQIYWSLLHCHTEVRPPKLGAARAVAAAYKAAHPNDVRAWMWSSRVELDSGQYEAALRPLSEVEQRGTASQRFQASRWVAKIYLEQGRRDDAIAKLEAILKEQPDDAATHHQLGQLFSTANPERAMTYFATATQLAPQSTPFCIDFGRALRKAKRLNDAIDQHVVCRDQNPDASEPRIELGLDYFLAGNDAAAVQEYRTALQTAPENVTAQQGAADVLNHLAFAAFRSGDTNDAEKLLVESRTLDRKSPTTASNLAVVYLAKSKFKNAIEVLEPLVKSAQSPIPHRLLGEAYAGLGQWAQAANHYASAAKEAQKKRNRQLVAEIYTAYGPALLRAGDHDQAIEILQQSVDMGSKMRSARAAKLNLQRARYERGVFNIKNGRFKRGASDLEATKRNATGLSVAQRQAQTMFLLTAYLELGRAAAARPLLRQLKSSSAGTKGWLKAPYDQGGVPFVLAYAAYVQGTGSRRSAAALTNATRQLSRFTTRGPRDLRMKSRDLAWTAWSLLAYEQFRQDKTKAAAESLAKAEKFVRQGRGWTVDHNRAVLTMKTKGSNARKVLERLSKDHAEALVNLGILHDRAGEHRRAHDAWVRAKTRGVRISRLQSWIDRKQQLFGF